MAAYIDRQGLEERFGVDEITDLLDDDRNDSESAEESATLTAAIADASNLIDGYLGSRYTLPLSFAPDIVISWCADIVRFRLWDEKAPEEVRRRYDDALAQLKLVAQGLIKLPPGSDGQGPETSSANGIDGFSACRIFTMDTLKGF